MIDAATFANSYNAFWNAQTPTCEHFVRRLNLDGYDRFRPPMAESGTAKRRALIAEYAFSLFVEHVKDATAGGDKRADDDIRQVAWLAAEIRLRPYSAQGVDLDNKFDDEENGEVQQILKRLNHFFSRIERSITLRPVFSGCGFVDASEGDVIFGETIYEIKTVDRPFRSSDVRQAITYAALNFASKQFPIDSVGLFNPRRGTFCDINLEEICLEISGRPSEDFLAIVVQAISSGEISR